MLSCFGVGHKGTKAGKEQQALKKCHGHGVQAHIPPTSQLGEALLVHSQGRALHDGASFFINGSSFPLTCIKAPEGICLEGYAQLCAALAESNIFFQSLLLTFFHTKDVPNPLPGPLVLDVAMPPSISLRGGPAGSTSFPSTLRLQYTLHKLNSESGASSQPVIPALHIGHLPSAPAAAGVLPKKSLAESNAEPDPELALYPPRPCKTSSAFQFVPQQRQLNQQISHSLQELCLQQGPPLVTGITQASSLQCPTQNHIKWKRQRSQLMQSEVPVLLTLLSQDGTVLEQNDKSSLYHGNVLGQKAWDLGSEEDRLLDDLEFPPGIIKDLFVFAPGLLSDVMEFLLDPRMGSWKSIVQVPAKATRVSRSQASAAGLSKASTMGQLRPDLAKGSMCCPEQQPLPMTAPTTQRSHASAMGQLRPDTAWNSMYCLQQHLLSASAPTTQNSQASAMGQLQPDTARNSTHLQAVPGDHSPQTELQPDQSISVSEIPPKAQSTRRGHTRIQAPTPLALTPSLPVQCSPCLKRSSASLQASSSFAAPRSLPVQHSQFNKSSTPLQASAFFAAHGRHSSMLLNACSAQLSDHNSSQSGAAALPISRNLQSSRVASQVAAKVASFSRDARFHQAWVDGWMSSSLSLIDSHGMIPRDHVDSIPKEPSVQNKLLLSSVDQVHVVPQGPLSHSSCIDKFAAYQDLRRDLRDSAAVSGARSRSRSRAETALLNSHEIIEWNTHQQAADGDNICATSPANVQPEGACQASSFSAPRPQGTSLDKSRVSGSGVKDRGQQRAAGGGEKAGAEGKTSPEGRSATCDQVWLSPSRPTSKKASRSKDDPGSSAQAEEPAFLLGGHEPKRATSGCGSRLGQEATPPYNYHDYPESEEERNPRTVRRSDRNSRGRRSMCAASHNASFAHTSGENGSAEVPMVYHECEIKCVTDPVTEQPAFLLIQRDASEQMMLENLLSELTEDQLAMLSQIFPRHIIQALSTDGAVTIDNIADLTCSHSNVTILLLDIVSFTATCGKESVTPESVIMFLNLLFSRFDRLVNKYQVQKIDTIGDAYLVASGILAPDAEGFWTLDREHDGRKGAGRMVALAVEMMRAGLEVRMPDGSPVQLRIGVHTGPCVSGLVGLEVPKWSVFGDTVNTAARLEQTSPAGSIQISEATLGLLPGGIDIGLVPSGGVDMKGKGCMETWLWRSPDDWVNRDPSRSLPDLPRGIEVLYQMCSPRSSSFRVSPKPSCALTQALQDYDDTKPLRQAPFLSGKYSSTGNQEEPKQDRPVSNAASLATHNSHKPDGLHTHQDGPVIEEQLLAGAFDSADALVQDTVHDAPLRPKRSFHLEASKSFPMPRTHETHAQGDTAWSRNSTLNTLGGLQRPKLFRNLSFRVTPLFTQCSSVFQDQSSFARASTRVTFAPGVHSSSPPGRHSSSLSARFSDPSSFGKQQATLKEYSKSYPKVTAMALHASSTKFQCAQSMPDALGKADCQAGQMLACPGTSNSGAPPVAHNLLKPEQHSSAASRPGISKSVAPPLVGNLSKPERRSSVAETHRSDQAPVQLQLRWGASAKQPELHGTQLQQGGNFEKQHESTKAPEQCSSAAEIHCNDQGLLQEGINTEKHESSKVLKQRSGAAERLWKNHASEQQGVGTEQREGNEVSEQQDTKGEQHGSREVSEQDESRGKVTEQQGARAEQHQSNKVSFQHQGFEAGQRGSQTERCYKSEGTPLQRGATLSCLTRLAPNLSTSFTPEAVSDSITSKSFTDNSLTKSFTSEAVSKLHQQNGSLPTSPPRLSTSFTSRAASKLHPRSSLTASSPRQSFTSKMQSSLYAAMPAETQRRAQQHSPRGSLTASPRPSFSSNVQSPLCATIPTEAQRGPAQPAAKLASKQASFRAALPGLSKRSVSGLGSKDMGVDSRGSGPNSDNKRITPTGTAATASGIMKASGALARAQAHLASAQQTHSNHHRANDNTASSQPEESRGQ